MELYQEGHRHKAAFLSAATGDVVRDRHHQVAGQPFRHHAAGGLRTSADLHEAASSRRKRRYVLARDVDAVKQVTSWWLCSIIQTFSDFQIISVLTGGDPANATTCSPTSTRSASSRPSVKAQPSLSCSGLLSWLGQLRYLRRLEGMRTTIADAGTAGTKPHPLGEGRRDSRGRRRPATPGSRAKPHWKGTLGLSEEGP